MRFAPTEKLAPWFPTTSASKFASVSLTPAITIEMMSEPIAFILEWNSKQSTPSPRSIRLAESLRATSLPLARRSSRSIAQGDTGTFSYCRVAGLKAWRTPSTVR